MIKGYRTYLVAAAGFLTGAGMVLNSVITKDSTNLSEGILLTFTSAAQFFQRAATNG